MRKEIKQNLVSSVVLRYNGITKLTFREERKKIVKMESGGRRKVRGDRNVDENVEGIIKTRRN